MVDDNTRKALLYFLKTRDEKFDKILIEGFCGECEVNKKAKCLKTDIDLEDFLFLFGGIPGRGSDYNPSKFIEIQVVLPLKTSTSG